jgi:hypothetical protein
MRRIDSATARSPIAVFKTNSRKGTMLRSCFARTFMGHFEVNRGEHLVGVFHRHMDRESVERQLHAALLHGASGD